MLSIARRAARVSSRSGNSRFLVRTATTAATTNIDSTTQNEKNPALFEVCEQMITRSGVCRIHTAMLMCVRGAL
jgi:hypothetical protein